MVAVPSILAELAAATLALVILEAMALESLLLLASTADLVAETVS